MSLTLLVPCDHCVGGLHLVRSAYLIEIGLWAGFFLICGEVFGVSNGLLPLSGQLHDFGLWRSDHDAVVEIAGPLDWDPLPAPALPGFPGTTSLSRYPIRPGRALARCRLILNFQHHRGVSRVASAFLWVHAVVTTPTGLLEAVRSYSPSSFGLPREGNRSAPALRVSRPTQRSSLLRPAHSPSRFNDLSTEGFSDFVASTAASVVTGWNEPVPGRIYLPLKSSAFSRRTPSFSRVLGELDRRQSGRNRIPRPNVRHSSGA